MYSNTGARNLMLLLFQFHYTSMLCTQGPAIHNTYHKAFCVLHSECSRELTIKPSLMTPNTLMCITWGDGGTPLITHTHTHTHTHVHTRFTVRPQSGFTQHRSQEIKAKPSPHFLQPHTNLYMDLHYMEFRAPLHMHLCMVYQVQGFR